MGMEKFVILDRGRDFTLTSLTDHLNQVFKVKKSGEPFTVADIHKYVSRGHLPAYLGGYPLERISDEKMGLKVIRIGKLND